MRTTADKFIAWGDKDYGGSIPSDVQAKLDSAPGITHLASAGYAFVVRTTACKRVSWCQADAALRCGGNGEHVSIHATTNIWVI